MGKESLPEQSIGVSPRGTLNPHSAELMDTGLWLARSTPELETWLFFSMGQETGQQSTGMVGWEIQPCHYTRLGPENGHLEMLLQLLFLE